MSFQPNFSAAPPAQHSSSFSAAPPAQNHAAQATAQTAVAVAAVTSPSNTAPPTFSWLEPHFQFVVVLVGPKEVPFGIQKDFLCAKSAYYRKHFAALSDAVESIVKLPNTPPEVFASAQHFMYTGIVFPHDASIPSYEVLVGVWKLGHDLGIDGLCDQTLETMIEVRQTTERIPAAPLLVQVWKDTPEGSSIRKLLLEWAAEYVRSSESNAEFAKSLPQEVLSELVLAMSRPDTSPLIQLGGDSPIEPTPPQSQRKMVHYIDQEEEDDEPAYIPAKKQRRSDPFTNGSASKAVAPKTKASKSSAKAAPAPRRRTNPAANGENMEFTTAQKLHFCHDLLTRMLSGPGEPTLADLGSFSHPAPSLFFLLFLEHRTPQNSVLICHVDAIRLTRPP